MLGRSASQIYILISKSSISVFLYIYIYCSTTDDDCCVLLVGIFEYLLCNRCGAICAHRAATAQFGALNRKPMCARRAKMLHRTIAGVQLKRYYLRRGGARADSPRPRRVSEAAEFSLMRPCRRDGASAARWRRTAMGRGAQ